MTMNRYKSGWFRDSQRHYLAAKYGSAGHTKKYLVDKSTMDWLKENPNYVPKGGSGADWMGKAFDLGANKYSIRQAEQLGEETMQADAASTSDLTFGWTLIPDSNVAAEHSESNSFMNGSQMMDDWFKAGKGEMTPVAHQMHESMETPQQEYEEHETPEQEAAEQQYMAKKKSFLDKVIPKKQAEKSYWTTYVDKKTGKVVAKEGHGKFAEQSWAANNIEKLSKEDRIVEK